MFKRIALFLATNLAVILVLSVVLRLLGVDRILDESGAGINYEALLILSLVIGFGGSFISLAMSKWMLEDLLQAVAVAVADIIACHPYVSQLDGAADQPVGSALRLYL